MNKQLIENNYIILPNFISKERSIDLSAEFLSHCEKNNVDGDSQAPNSYSTYNYISFLELLCEKTPEISSLIEETVLPTYVYSRVYKNGSELLAHTDRDACEISVTLHLDGDSSWPIWIETPSGEKRCVKLNPGDTMIYLGRNAVHWRGPYQGKNYTQVFLHYVRSRGDCSYTYFDKLNETEKPITDNTDIKQIITETKTTSPRSKKSLEDYIFTLDNVVSEELCNRIIEEYRDCSFWSPTTVGSGNLNHEIRNCDTINISESVVLEKNFDVRKKIDEDFYVCASESINEYRKLFPNVAQKLILDMVC
jgi:hypothetical protein